MQYEAFTRKYYFTRLKKFNLPKTMIMYFYPAIAIWYTAATAKDQGRLKNTIHSVEKVIGCNLHPVHNQ